MLNIFGALLNLESTIDRFTPKISLETFLDSVGDCVDDFIIDKQIEGMCFLGGKTMFALDDDKAYILIHSELFFRETDGGFTKTENDGAFRYHLLKPESRDRFLEQIEDNGILVLEVSEP